MLANKSNFFLGPVHWSHPWAWATDIIPGTGPPWAIPGPGLLISNLIPGTGLIPSLGLATDPIDGPWPLVPIRGLRHWSNPWAWATSSYLGPGHLSQPWAWATGPVPGPGTLVPTLGLGYWSCPWARDTGPSLCLGHWSHPETYATDPIPGPVPQFYIWRGLLVLSQDPGKWSVSGPGPLVPYLNLDH